MKFELNEFNNYDVILVCGLPGSGKSFFAKHNFSESGRKRINRAEIRKLMFEMTNFGKVWHESDFNENDEALTKHVERKIIEHLLHYGDKLLIDNTSVTRHSRKNYIDISKSYNKKISVIFINTPVQKCLERNRLREDKKPENLISQLFSQIELPDRKEGFEKVAIIDN